MSKVEICEEIQSNRQMAREKIKKIETCYGHCWNAGCGAGEYGLPWESQCKYFDYIGDVRCKADKLNRYCEDLIEYEHKRVKNGFFETKIIRVPAKCHAAKWVDGNVRDCLNKLR